MSGDAFLHTSISGHAFLDMLFWTLFSKNTFLGIPLRTYLSGHTFQDFPRWTGLSGHALLDMPFLWLWGHHFLHPAGEGRADFGTDLRAKKGTGCNDQNFPKLGPKSEPVLGPENGT